MANNAAAEMGAFRCADQVEARTVRVGSMDVVNQEQFIEGMQRTAKTARAQLLNDLKNKPSMRSGSVYEHRNRHVYLVSRA